MPIYEYKCEKCKKITERFFKINEDSNYIICDCDYIANKILSPGIFNIKGFSENNGYSKEEK